MIVNVKYSKQAKKFLDKNSSLLSESQIDNLALSSVKKIYKIENANIDLKPLKGNLKGFYRIRVSNIRIVFNIEEESQNNKLIVIFSAKDINFRGNIYN